MVAKSKSEIVFKSFPKQDEFIEAIESGKYDFILYGGAIRGGKTMIALGYFILLSKLFPGSKYLVVRKDTERIRNTVLPTFEQIKPVNFTKKDPTKGNGYEWIATNGSMIKFYGENIDKDPELKRYRGLEYDSVLLEEMDIQEDTFYAAIERCGTWKMKERQESRRKGDLVPPTVVVGTSNPQKGWVKREIYDKWKTGKLKPNWLYIRSRVFDNPYVDKEWIKRQKDNLTEMRYNMMIEGDWEVNTNKSPFFQEFDYNTHVVESTTLNPLNPIWLSWDFNYDPGTCIIASHNPDRGIQIHKTIQKKGGTYAVCKDLKPYREEIQAPVFVCGDNSGTKSDSRVGNHNDYKIIQEELDIPTRWLKEVSNANRTHSYSQDLCNLVFKHIPVFIQKKGNESLINDLEIAEIKVLPSGKEELRKDRNKGMGMDAVDALRYLFDALFPKGYKDVMKAKELITGQKPKTKKPKIKLKL